MVETLYWFRCLASLRVSKDLVFNFIKIPKERNLLIFGYANLVCIAKKFCQINTGQGSFATAINRAGQNFVFSYLKNLC